MSKVVDTSDEWIVERTGIRARHIAGEGETTRTLGLAAARKALEHAGSRSSRCRSHHPCHLDARPDLSGHRDHDPGRSRHHARCRLRRAGGLLRLCLCPDHRRCDDPVADRRNARWSSARKPSRASSTGPTARTCVLFGDGAGAVVLTAEAGSGAHCRPRHPRHPDPFRWALCGQALCRRRPFHHRNRGPSAHGGPRGLQARGGQHRLGHGRGDHGSRT